MKKKITFVIFSLGSGGAEKVLSVISKALADNHDITIITLAKCDDFYEIDGVKRVRLQLDMPSKGIINGVFNNIKRLLMLKKELDNFDCVISFMTQTNILVLLSTIWSGKKIIISEHNSRSFVPSFLWRTLQRLLYPLANHLVCVSNSVNSEYKFCQNRITIGNPLEPNIEKLAELEPPLVLPKQFLVAVGRCDEAKGHQYVIKAFKMIAKEFPELSLVIIGDGVMREELEKMSAGENIVFTGRLSNPYGLIKRSLGLVSGSTSEGFGNVLIEAMSLKKPVIGFACEGAIAELIYDESIGYLVPCKDISILAKYMRQVVQSHRENQAGYESSRRFCLENIIKEWERIV